MMYGTVVGSAVLSMNVMSRLPESMRAPRVGQPDAGSGSVVGEYDMVSSPTDEKTVAYGVAGMLSMFTINNDKTAKK
jgi:hypothetical protein